MTENEQREAFKACLTVLFHYPDADKELRRTALNCVLWEFEHLEPRIPFFPKFTPRPNLRKYLFDIGTGRAS